MLCILAIGQISPVLYLIRPDGKAIDLSREQVSRRSSARSNMVAQINRTYVFHKNAESRLKHAPYAFVTVIGTSTSNRRVDVNLRGRPRPAD